MSNTNDTPTLRFIINCVLYPLVFVVMFPLEYSTWKAYKKEGYHVPNYFKFVYKRNFK